MGCCKVLKIAGFLVLGFLLFNCFFCCQTPSLPYLNPDAWWGPGNPSKDDPSIRPFKIQVSKEDVDDLKTRLALPYRLTAGLENSNFTYGFNGETLKVITDYWKNKYDWPAREAKLNKFPQFKTQIEGLDIHFIHVVPKVTSNKKVLPLLLVHGWPGSVAEFDEILPILTSPQPDSDYVFEVICPSIPGYAFSQGSSKMGLGVPHTGQIFLKLMKRLGKEKFYVQGGDWGSFIVSTMATYYPDNVLGMHINMFTVVSPWINFKLLMGSYLPSGWIMPAEDEERFYPISRFFSFLTAETGYLHIQSTKPDTVGASLNNSPMGLAAYILEKFSTGTQASNPNKPDGGLLSKDFPISLERLLDNISLYWFSKSMTTSMRYYAENVPNLFAWKLDQIPTLVPSGLTTFRNEFTNCPENFAAYKYKNIVSFRKHSFGGHFAAMELPTVLAKDVFEFVTIVEKQSTNSRKSEL